MTRKGWRIFRCDECGYDWAEPTRDRFSPSRECCPLCQVLTTPIRSLEDDKLQTDRFGNLIKADTDGSR